MVRSTMAFLILRVRQLTNDTDLSCQQFSDQDYQDMLDASRIDVRNGSMKYQTTFSGSTILFLDYFAELGDWESDVVLKQYLTNVVTPTTSEFLVGHWQFAETTLPPVFISGKTYDIYRAAADILQRQSIKWAMAYNVGVDGQSLQRSQIFAALQKQIAVYRMMQRPTTVTTSRSDLVSRRGVSQPGLRAQPIDYMGSGDGR